MKYFPEMINNDEYVTEFSVLQKKNEMFLALTKLTPEVAKFKRPDFGFNDFMTFED